ncbi:MAG: hypothetical protein HRT88_02075 [Lentisphaeraceae bacterium]|nr:hypothetical protein [Lentisphaeraceae bacterium]
MPLSKAQRNQQILDYIREQSPSAAVEALVGLNEKTDFKARMQALGELSKKLSEYDIKALVAFLKTQYTSELNMEPIYYNSVKNDALQLLLTQEERIDGIGAVLVEMANDTSYGDMWRDYSLQFIPDYYQQAYDVDLLYSSDVSQERDDLLSTLWNFAEDKRANSSATALIALESLAQNYREIEKSRIVETAMDIVNDGTTPIGARISAMRLAIDKEVQADKGASDYFGENVRIIAQTGENIVLRMSAVKTPGEIGNTDDVEFLEGLLGHKDKIMVKVAEAALGKLKK